MNIENSISGQTQWQTPSVGVVIPVRNSQRTIRHAVEAILQQNYTGQIAIWIVGNTDDQDNTWQALDGLLDHPLITCMKIHRPENWHGRDANLKRLRGCEAAFAAGYEVLALIDSQIFAPRDWLSRAITLFRLYGVDGIAGISRRHPEDRTLSGVYQDHSLFSEWPRYGSRFFLTRDSFGKAPGLPITASLLFSRQIFTEVRHAWPGGCTHGWEDFLLAWNTVSLGATILCTDDLWVYRNHKRKFRLAKQLSAGSGAYQFYKDHPDCEYARILMQKALLTFMVFLLLATITLTAPFTFGSTLIFSLAVMLSAGMLSLGVVSMLKAQDIRGFCFPLLDVAHIAIWLGGACYLALRNGHADPGFAKFLIQYR